MHQPTLKLGGPTDALPAPLPPSIRGVDGSIEVGVVVGCWSTRSRGVFCWSVAVVLPVRQSAWRVPPAIVNSPDSDVNEHPLQSAVGAATSIAVDTPHTSRVALNTPMNSERRSHESVNGGSLALTPWATTEGCQFAWLVQYSHGVRSRSPRRRPTRGHHG